MFGAEDKRASQRGIENQPRERNDSNTTMKIQIRGARLGVLVVVRVPVFGCAEPMRGAGKSLTVVYPAPTATNELQTAVTYTLWLPAGAALLRGIIVHQHGAGTTASKEGS